MDRAAAATLPLLEEAREKAREEALKDPERRAEARAALEEADRVALELQRLRDADLGGAAVAGALKTLAAAAEAARNLGPYLAKDFAARFAKDAAAHVDEHLVLTLAEFALELASPSVYPRRASGGALS